MSTVHAQHGRHEQADPPEGAQEDSQGNHLRGMQSPKICLGADDGNLPEEVHGDELGRVAIISVP